MGDGSKVARKRLMARYLWEAVSTGEIRFPDGKVIVLSPDDVLAIIQFLYKHIDGPPISQVDVTSGGNTIQIEYINSPYPVANVSSVTSGDTSEVEQV
jgi:hypothetical protein